MTEDDGPLLEAPDDELLRGDLQGFTPGLIGGEVLQVGRRTGWGTMDEMQVLIKIEMSVWGMAWWMW